MPRGRSGGGSSGGLHYTKSGNLDMRYSSSKAAVASGYYGGGGGGSSGGYGGGGSSYSGTPSASSYSPGYAPVFAGPAFISPSVGSGELHYTRSGNLDMRYSSSKAAVASGYSGGSSSYAPVSSGYAPVSAAPATISSTAALHLKKDGTPDMRYTSSKQYVSGGATQVHSTTSGSSTAYASAGLHLKKDGTPDMRYSSSKEFVSGRPVSAPPAKTSATSATGSAGAVHVKKDGTLDMRYLSSKAALASSASSANAPAGIPLTKSGKPDMRFKAAREYAQLAKIGAAGSKRVMAGNPGMSPVPDDIPTKRDGSPDMRYSAAKEWVRKQAHACAEGSMPLPAYVPTKKDGTPDASTAVGRAFLDAMGLGGHARTDYWDERAGDSEFDEMFRQAQQRPVDIPPPTQLEDTGAIQQAMWQDYQQQGQQGAPQGYDGATGSSTPQDYGRDADAASGTVRSAGGGAVDRWAIDIPESLVPKILPEEIEEGEELGRGAFGVVYKGTLTRGGKRADVAIKRLHMRALTKRDKALFVEEIRKHARLGKHPNLVNIEGYMEEPPAMVLEYVPLGSLDYLLHICEETGVEVMMARGAVKKKLLHGIVDGMRQLHAAGVIHRDLKSANVLVTADYVAKVTDFGMATLRTKTSNTVASHVTAGGDGEEDGPGGGAGTPAYMAPELLDFSILGSFSTDVYAFGVLLNEIVSEQQPYEDQIHRLAGRGPYAAMEYAKQGNRPTVAPHVTPFVKELILRCWHKDPKQRPTFEEILTGYLLDARFVIKDMVGQGSSATDISAQSMRATRPPLSSDPKGKSTLGSQSLAGASIGAPAPRPAAPRAPPSNPGTRGTNDSDAGHKAPTSATTAARSSLLESLVGMGFTRCDAVAALDATHDDVEDAIDYLSTKDAPSLSAKDRAAISRLIDMGFDQDAAAAAYKSTGEVQMAAELLLLGL